MAARACGCVKDSLTYYMMYKMLRNRFGYLDWWPGETNDEIIIGAILTQQTSWKNVERALANLKESHAVNLKKIGRMNLKKLENLLKPSGFYHQKARRLKAISKYIYNNYISLDELLSKDRVSLRKELLSLDGVGKETADSIILYAAEKPAFVVDAYARRILNRVYGTDTDIEYDKLSAMIEGAIKRDLGLYKDFHAQLVELGKRHCRLKPVCKGCPINEHCAYFISLTK